jgi:hypothetical protein
VEPDLGGLPRVAILRRAGSQAGSQAPRP